jgi:hypothetical protein
MTPKLVLVVRVVVVVVLWFDCIPVENSYNCVDSAIPAWADLYSILPKLGPNIVQEI